MLTECKVNEIFRICDDFCKEFDRSEERRVGKEC